MQFNVTVCPPHPHCYVAWPAVSRRLSHWFGSLKGRVTPSTTRKWQTARVRAGRRAMWSKLLVVRHRVLLSEGPSHSAFRLETIWDWVAALSSQPLSSAPPSWAGRPGGSPRADLSCV